MRNQRGISIESISDAGKWYSSGKDNIQVKRESNPNGRGFGEEDGSEQKMDAI